MSIIQTLQQKADILIERIEQEPDVDEIIKLRRDYDGIIFRLEAEKNRSNPKKWKDKREYSIPRKSIKSRMKM